MQQLAVGGHDLHGKQVVAGQPEFAGQAPQPTAQRQARNAGIRDSAQRRDEAASLCLAIELAEQHTGLSPRRLCGSIDPDGLEAREVDDQAAIAPRLPGKAMATAADRREQIVGAGEIDRPHHVSRPGAAGNERGVPIE